MSYCSSGCTCPDYYKIIGMDKTVYIIIKETIGIIAAFLTGITLMPQVYIAIKSKGEKTMNYTFLIITLIATIFWLVYGMLLGSIQTVVLEVIVFINVIILFISRLIYQIKNRNL
tara:strand:- start:491 stop:835 length:345 start_codon:yes stop_codon:yes gene_type:complete